MLNFFCFFNFKLFRIPQNFSFSPLCGIVNDFEHLTGPNVSYISSNAQFVNKQNFFLTPPYLPLSTPLINHQSNSVYTGNLANNFLYPFVPPQNPGLLKQECSLMGEFLPYCTESVNNGIIKMPFLNAPPKLKKLFRVRAVLANDGSEHYGIGNTKFQAKNEAATKVNFYIKNLFLNFRF